jgi:hypothetical protein
MEHHQDGSNTLIGFMFTMIFNLLAIIANAWNVSETILHVLQAAAYAGAITSATITALNYFEIKWNPFKKRKK